MSTDLSSDDLSKAAFGDQALARFRAAFANATWTRVDPLGFECQVPGDDRRFRVHLDNGYQAFLANPEQIDDILGRYLSSVAQLLAPPVAPDLDRIWPLLKGCDWLQALGDQSGDLWCDPLNPELLVVYAASREHLRILRRDIFGAEQNEADWRSAALRNLATQVGQIEWVGEDEIRFASTDGFEASAALLPNALNDFPGPPQADRYIGVPDRNSFLVAIDAAPASIFWLARGTAHLFRTEPHNISPHIFRWSNGAMALVDDLSDDEMHPIPRIGSADVLVKTRAGGALMGIVIASPLDASVRSVYRLFRKLDGYLSYLWSDDAIAEFGEPSRDRTTIELRLHHGSDPAIREILESHRDWIEEHALRFELASLPPVPE